MKSIKIAGLCLVAMLTMSLAMASNALAVKTGPHWVVCVKKTGGTWNDKQCSKRGAGEEWETKQLLANETKAIEFTSGLSELVTKNKEGTITHEIKCAQDKGTGFIAGGSPGTNRETIRFEKCKAKEGIIECEAKNKTGPVKEKETIVVTVNSELVYLNETKAKEEKPPLGILFRTTKNKEKAFVELEFGFPCNILNGTVTATGGERAAGGIEGVAGVVCEAVEPAETLAVEHFLHCPTTAIHEFFYWVAPNLISGKAGLEFNAEESIQSGQAQVELASKEDFASWGR